MLQIDWSTAVGRS